MLRNHTLEIQPVTGGCGAEILNIDLRRDHDENVWRDIRQTLNDHAVIFFRDQDLSPEQFIAFGKRFGDLTNSRFIPTNKDYPEIAEIRKEPEQKNNVGSSWHTDQPFREIPVMGTILLARELPDFGGDTLFINMTRVYDSLSDGLKRTLEGLDAVHSNEHVIGRKTPADKRDKGGSMVNMDDATQTTIHPVVTRHPESGRKTLYVSPSYTVRFDGWTEEESRPLLQMLHQQAMRPEFSCRFQWRQGSLAFWDNRQTLHYAANDYHGQRRLMHRMMIQGVKPIAARGH